MAALWGEGEVRVSGLVRRQKLAERELGRRGSADMEELPLGVSLAKAVADNGGESVLRKRLVAWNNEYLMRTGRTGNR